MMRQTLVLASLIVTAAVSYAIANGGPTPAPENCDDPNGAGCVQKRINDLAHVAQWITTTAYIKMPVSVDMCNRTNPPSVQYQGAEFTANDGTTVSYSSCPRNTAHHFCQSAGFAAAHGLDDAGEAVLVANDEIVCIARPALGLHR